MALSETIRAFVTSSVGVLALAAGLAGMPVQRCSKATTALRIACRAMLMAGGLLFVNPTLTTDVLGLALIAAEVLIDKLVLAKAKPVGAAV